MTTGEGADPRDARDEHEQRPGRGERIGIGGGDDAVTRIQLAARWAEAYGRGPDSLASVLKRFRAAYEYLDAVTHGIEPGQLEEELQDMRAVVPPAGAQVPPPPAPEPHPQPTYSPPQSAQPTYGAPPEQRPWG